MASNETRRRILDAAEALFARQGFGATSLRTVIAKARVNLAAIHYHFGSKDALIRAVFARRIAPLNAERLVRLDRCVASAAPDGPSVEAVLESLIRPALGFDRSVGSGAPPLAALIARVHGEADEAVSALLYEQFEDASRRYLAVLSELLPHLSHEERSTRFHFVISSMASALCDVQRIEHLSQDGLRDREVEPLVANLITFLAAGLRAPASPPPASTASAPNRRVRKKEAAARDTDPCGEVSV